MQDSVPAKIKRLHEYWSNLANGAVPERTAFDPAMIRDLLPNVMLLDFEETPFRVRFRLSGTRVDAVTGMNITGRYLDELTMDEDPRRIEQLQDLYASCIRRGDVYIGAMEWPNKLGLSTTVSLGIFPLKVDGVIAQLLVIEDYSEIAEENRPLQWHTVDGA